VILLRHDVAPADAVPKRKALERRAVEKVRKGEDNEIAAVGDVHLLRCAFDRNRLFSVVPATLTTRYSCAALQSRTASSSQGRRAISGPASE